jgi:RNA polymerase sigma-70 factor (sigma-E family)
VASETAILPVEAGLAARPTFADLYRAESARTTRLAFLLTGDRHLAEDLMQEAFVRVGSRLRHVDPATFGPYVRKTVVNLVRSHYRRASVQAKYAPHAREAQDESGADTDTRAELWGALQQLPARQREAIVCRYYLDMTEAETARTLGISLGTVKSSTSRGLSALRAVLEREREL